MLGSPGKAVGAVEKAVTSSALCLVNGSGGVTERGESNFAVGGSGFRHTEDRGRAGGLGLLADVPYVGGSYPAPGDATADA